MTDTSIVDDRTGQSSLNQVPARQRRLLALLVAPPAGLILLAGLLMLVLSQATATRLAGLPVAAIGLVLLGIAQGLHRSARLEARAAAEQRLDTAILAAAGPCGSGCDGGSAGSCGASDCAVKALPRG